MKLEVRNQGDVTVIVPAGSLVIAPPEQTNNETVTRLLAAARTRFFVDLADVTKYASSRIET